MQISCSCLAFSRKKDGVWAGPEGINLGNYRVRFQIEEKKKEYCIMVLALGIGTKGESTLGANSNGSLRLRNFFYIIKIINYLSAVIVVAVYYTIISPDVAEAEFIFCIFY